MKILLLGGNNIKNREWLKKMEVFMNGFHADIFRHDYLHWQTSDSSIDLGMELQRIEKIIGNSGRYAIVAKSAGALLTLKGIHEKRICPSACVFFGAAILWGKERKYEVERWLLNYSIPTLFIHHSNDPAITSCDLLTILQKNGVQNYNIFVVPGNEHDYLDFVEYAFMIQPFLKRIANGKINK